MRYSFLLISLFVFLVIFSVNFFVFDAYARAPVLNIERSLYLVDGVFHLEGTADPDTRVELEFSKTGSRSFRRFIDSEKTGIWSFNERLKIDEGDWIVRARARVDGGGNSEWSDAVVFQSIVYARGVNGIFLAGIAGIAVMLFFVFKMTRRFAKRVPLNDAAQSYGVIGFGQRQKPLMRRFQAIAPETNDGEEKSETRRIENIKI